MTSPPPAGIMGDVRTKGRRVAIAVSVLGVATIVGAGMVVRDRVFEEWFLYRFRTGEEKPKVEAVDWLRRHRIPLTFFSWDLAVEFLQWQERNQIPPGEKTREEIKRDSPTVDLSVQNYDFRIISLDWRGKSRFGIRGKNGPIYVFWKRGSHYNLVGGFLGESVDIVGTGDCPLVMLHYHVSVNAEPPMGFPFVDGTFNRGDLAEFK